MSAEKPSRRPKRNKESATGSFVDDWRGSYLGPDCYGVGPTFSGWSGHKLGGSRK